MRPGHIWAVVVAAGRGTRFGSAKQFAALGATTVVDMSVAAARRHTDGVVVVVPESGPFRFDAADAVAIGGDTRSASVRAGLEIVPDDGTMILVHDAARPLASDDVFERVVAALRAGADAVVPVVPVTDTLRRIDGSVVARDQLVAVQTPQGFAREVLEAAHSRGGDATDDSALAEAAGYAVELVEGDPRNLKITDPHDLVVVQGLLDAGSHGHGEPGDRSAV